MRRIPDRLNLRAPTISAQTLQAAGGAELTRQDSEGRMAGQGQRGAWTGSWEQGRGQLAEEFPKFFSLGTPHSKSPILKKNIMYV